MDDIPFVIHHDIHQILGVLHGIPSQLPQSFCKYGSTGNPEVKTPRWLGEDMKVGIGSLARGIHL